MAAAGHNKPQTVSIKTFKSWDFHQDFTIEDDGDKITKIQCNVCSHHVVEISKKLRPQWSGKNNPTIVSLFDKINT